ncbi:MAG: hypothetical protein M1834_002410 [Cirrosporium novae-zelandiae]|nr:MAG: hypothetical protein M1834_002410 [Cirrosporium novae-zelandiae]
MAGWVFRENRVPHYQRQYQSADGLRLWQKSARSKAFLLPYYAILFGSFTATMYAMARMVLVSQQFLTVIGALNPITSKLQLLMILQSTGPQDLVGKIKDPLDILWLKWDFNFDMQKDPNLSSIGVYNQDFPTSIENTMSALFFTILV